MALVRNLSLLPMVIPLSTYPRGNHVVLFTVPNLISILVLNTLIRGQSIKRPAIDNRRPQCPVLLPLASPLTSMLQLRCYRPFYRTLFNRQRCRQHPRLLRTYHSRSPRRACRLRCAPPLDTCRMQRNRCPTCRWVISGEWTGKKLRHSPPWPCPTVKIFWRKAIKKSFVPRLSILFNICVCNFLAITPNEHARLTTDPAESFLQ